MCAQINSNPYLNLKVDVVLSLSGHSGATVSLTFLSSSRHFNTVSYANLVLLNETARYPTEADFVRSVYAVYSNLSSPYSLDLSFNAERTAILASRFLIQGKNIHSTKDEERMVTEIRAICRRFSTPQVGGGESTLKGQCHEDSSYLINLGMIIIYENSARSQEKLIPLTEIFVRWSRTCNDIL
jgi:hypothetical protein